MDRSRQNKDSLTNISSLKRGSRPNSLLSDGTGRSSAPATEAALRSRPDGSYFVRDQARRGSESFRTTASCWTPLKLSEVSEKRYWSASSWLGLAQTLFAENILERGHKFVKEVVRKFRREHCLNSEAKRRLSLRAIGHFFDRLNPYLSDLSERRAFSRKGVWANPLFDEKGQTLVELMIAMSVMSIGFLGVFAVLSQSLGLNRVVANQYIAANLAAEGIEVVKNIADSNTLQPGGVWNAGLGNGDFGVEHKSVLLNEDWANQDLKFDANTGLYGYDAGAPTNFRRTVSITNITVNEMQVKSVVTWPDRGGTVFKIELEDRFFNWR